MKLSKLLLSYLADRRYALLLAAVFTAIACVVFGLYRLPLGAVLYAALLCAAVAGVFFIFGFLSYRKRRLCLFALRQSITADCTSLPAPHNGVESDYTALLRTLHLHTTAQAEDGLARTRERDEYYTLWMHQIKTPIAAMRLLLQDEDTPESRDINSQLFMIERYVEMALAYLRTESKSTDYLFRTYDLDTIVRQCIRKYAPLFILKKLQIEKQPIDCQVLTDEKWLSFVIEQLLSNAVKYTPAGSVTVCVENSDTLVIRDTGIGIAPEDLPRICENGFTGYNGRRDKHASGIGLYLTNKVVHRLGHTLSFTSTPGAGTTVRLGLHTDASLYD